MNNINYIWQNNKVVAFNNSNSISIYSAGFRYGLVVFDALVGSKALDGYRVFRPQAHINRFLKGIKLLGLNCPFTFEELLSGIEKVIKKNRPDERFGVRLFAYADGETYLNKQCAVIIFLIDLNIVSFRKQISVYTGPECCYNSSGIPSSVKCTSHYANRRFIFLNWLKKNKKKIDDFVFVNPQGNVLETSRANLFVLKGSMIYTPTADLEILNGITRQSLITVINNTKSLFQNKVKEDIINYKMLLDADEILITSTSVGIESVTSINSKKLNLEYGAKIRELYLNYSKTKTGWHHSI